MNLLFYRWYVFFVRRYGRTDIPEKIRDIPENKKCPSQKVGGRKCRSRRWRRQACSSHHQIVIWICFWFSVCQAQQKWKQILRRQCCLYTGGKYKIQNMKLKAKCRHTGEKWPGWRGGPGDCASWPHCYPIIVSQVKFTRIVKHFNPWKKTRMTLTKPK